MLKNGHIDGGFSVISCKGQDRLLFIHEGSISIYNPGNLSAPTAQFDISSLNLSIQLEGGYQKGRYSAMWGDNLLLAGSFGNGTSGLVEINLETGAVVNRYTRANSRTCCVVVCGNRIYLSFVPDDDGAPFDFAEMSSVGVITDELTSLESLEGLGFNELASAGGKLYAGYSINSISGLVRFDSSVNAASGTTLINGDPYVFAETVSGTDGDVVFAVSTSSDVSIYRAQGNGSAVKIYTVGPRIISQNINTYIESLYYDTNNRHSRHT